MTTVDRQLSPRIVSLATAVPPHRVPQAEAVEFFNRFFDISPAQRQQLTNVFLNAEIDSRFAAAPVHWYEQRHDFEQKNDEYIDSAVGLLKQVAVESLATANLDCTDIDMIVTVSTTGIAVPALDARLMEELRFRRNVQRLPLFGLGCAGGVLGLARAAACARAQPGSRVVFLVVELCSLTFCGGDRTPANIVATALFGDGAAAAVLSTAEAGPAVKAWGEHTWPGSLDVMGWHVTRNGLEAVCERSSEDWTGNLSDAANRAVSVPPGVLARYIGVYTGIYAGNERTYEVSLAGGRLIATIVGPYDAIGLGAAGPDQGAPRPLVPQSHLWGRAIR